MGISYSGPIGVGLRVARDSQPADRQGLRTEPSASPAPKLPVGSPDAAARTGGAKQATDSTGSPHSKPAPPLAKGSPEEKLSTRGLSRSGTYFVVESETEILEKFAKMRPLIASIAQPFNTFARALRNEMLLADAEWYHNDMRARVDEASKVLSTMPNGAKANSQEKLDYQAAQAFLDGLTQERDNASRAVEAIRAQQIPAGRKEELVKDFKAKWSDFLRATDELTPLIDSALGEYRKLRSDPSVTDALAALSRSTKAAAHLGPSKNLQKALDTIKEAKRAYAPETAAPKKKTRPAKMTPTAPPKNKGQATKH